MNLKVSSYSNFLYEKEKRLVNIGTSVKVYDILEDPPVLLFNFKNLKNPSYVAISSNKEFLAYSNTSGHIVLHSLNTGELIWKNRCFNEEGCQLYFIENNTKLLTACNLCKDNHFYGRIYTIDLQTQQIVVLWDTEQMITDLYLLENTDQVVYFQNALWKSEQDNFEEKLSIEDFPDKIEENTNALSFLEDAFKNIMEKLDAEEIVENAEDLTIKPAQVHLFNYKTCDDKVVVEGGCEYKDFMSQKENQYYFQMLNENSEDVLIKHRFDTGKSEIILRFKDFIKKLDSISNITISPDENTLLAKVSWGLSNEGIAVVDLKEKRLLHFCNTKYLSSIRFTKNGRKVLIGTWEKIILLDYEELLKMDRI